MSTPLSSAARTLRAGDRTPTPRTLVDVFASTVSRFPDAPAIDDGDEVLTYRALAQAVEVRAARLAAVGVRRGDRVGVRAASGTVGLYVSVLAVLHAGAAYVPVDADDPDERAHRVFTDAGVVAVLGDGPEPLRPDGTPAKRLGARHAEVPTLDDGAWVIFTSGSTGRPKGVEVSHRSAAAFVDAEARLFLRDAPIGPGDRVLAGLSVAFDASCEEMWLAWRHGATLVPAPRALVRTGSELGPWLVDRDITVVSTVPTLAGLWPVDALAAVRLLIFGGEAVPPELATRLWAPGRELWNTYGPTEATVVACAALLLPDEPVRIGLPLDGWDLAVVDAEGREVPEGGTGELLIGGVGVARYLDPELDAARFGPHEGLGWDRAYRTGDLVVADPEGLLFVGRADDQVKVNGHRIELAEVDTALQALPGVAGAAAAVRRSTAGGTVLVGYLAPRDGERLDLHDLLRSLRETLPGSMVPLLAVVEHIPTRTSGKVDRDALPWPLPDAGDGDAAPLDGLAGWVGEQWAAVVGVRPQHEDDDFFAHGGSSLTAAQLVSALRARYPEITVAEVYDHPSVGGLAEHLAATWPSDDDGTGTSGAAAPARTCTVTPVPVASQVVQLLALLPLRGLVALRWLTVVAAVGTVLHTVWGVAWALAVPWWWLVAGWLVTVSPLGRLGVCALGARLLLAGVRPGSYPRGGHVHLRLWAAERLVDGFGAVTPASAPWISLYARALGAEVGRDVDLHSVPPVTGFLSLGHGCAIEPEVDLSGHWVDGDVLHVGRIRVGPGATVGARSVLLPGSRVRGGTDVAAGSAVHGTTGSDEFWSGSPAVRQHEARHPWPTTRPPASRAGWTAVFAATGAAVSALPSLAALPALAVLGTALAPTPSLAAAVGPALAWTLVAVPLAYLTYALLVLVGVRLLARGLHEGCHPVRSGAGVRAWAVSRLMDAARTALFPLYSSLLTPAWLRLLGARVGRETEISTVVGLPSMMQVKDGAFLADDTMVAPYELGGGWLRVATAKVGRRAFLGNSGMTAPGRTVPKNGLVAVLSATPSRTRAGSSYLGSPPVLLARAAAVDDGERTYTSTPALRRARGAVEACRVVPLLVLGLLWVGAGLAFQALAAAGGWLLAVAAGGVVLLALGVLGAAVTVAAKWALAGRFRDAEHPLWSAPVWRGELADTFTEVVAAPLLANPVTGSVALVWWLRSMGARIGRGVWCETYWLPEADLVRLGDGASVGPGCVVQTHLFHDRVMSLDTVTLRDGATLGPHGVVLPAALLDEGATVGPASLVLRGETVPAGSRWVGNPIGPWRAPVGAS
ncbi:Pls/PosA family non-ribosomal peptide synthetase [Cellulomonas cellasea]|uniref:Non-ribosomal peptide synthetase-like protein n=1 Tax=Cellulomonas cellasea TaxID=43670 RepID=A0A7W4UFS4_9CELL|nr:Pls/PosA family non-ribosomal peptide synthetase [Cellulomonas cellasea]MBB2923383.1 non-ribosomal peptide synthetase-like protein [Cellulomonas cellasea]